MKRRVVLTMTLALVGCVAPPPTDPYRELRRTHFAYTWRSSITEPQLSLAVHIEPGGLARIQNFVPGRGLVERRVRLASNDYEAVMLAIAGAIIAEARPVRPGARYPRPSPMVRLTAQRDDLFIAMEGPIYAEWRAELQLAAHLIEQAVNPALPYQAAVDLAPGWQFARVTPVLPLKWPVTRDHAPLVRYAFGERASMPRGTEVTGLLARGTEEADGTVQVERLGDWRVAGQEGLGRADPQTLWLAHRQPAVEQLLRAPISPEDEPFVRVVTCSWLSSMPEVVQNEILLRHPTFLAWLACRTVPLGLN